MNRDMKRLFDKYEANYDTEHLTEEQFMRVIQDPNAFSRKKKVNQTKPKTKKRTKRNRR